MIMRAPYPLDMKIGVSKDIFSAIIFHNKPVHLILYVTNKCPLRCKTCFVRFNEKEETELSLEEIRKFSSFFDKLIWLDIGGGEPFLRKDLAEIIASFNAKFIGIPTNGFNPLLIAKTVEEIRRKTGGEVRIDVSIDGFEETNDEIRGVGSYKNAVETLKLLRSINGIRLKINTVLCNANFDEIIDFMKFMKRFDADTHSIIFRRGPKEVAPLYRCPSYEKLAIIRKEIFKLWDTYDYRFNAIGCSILRSFQKMTFDISMKIIKEKRQMPACLAGRHHAVIYPNGDISFCEILPPFGNIRAKNIGDLLYSAEANLCRRFINGKKCYCHHNCNLLDNFFLNPAQYPKLFINAFNDFCKNRIFCQRHGRL